MKKIVLYSNKHRADDNRIVELEAKIFSAAGLDTTVYAKTQDVNIEYPGIKYKTCKEKHKDCLSQCISEDGDLYIFHDPGLLLCAVKLHKRGKCVIFDSHENYEEKLKTRFSARFPYLKMFRKYIAKLWWLYEKKCVTNLDGAICADRTVQEKYGIKTYLLPNMPTKDFYEKLPERKVDDSIFQLIYVGTLSWDRGIVETIEAIKLCNHKNIVFHIIGDTTDEKLKELIMNDKNTIWHGRVKWNLLKEYLVNVDLGVVLLQPTEAYLYYPGENIVKLWEYMSVGLPVLISDFPKLKVLNNSLKFGMNVKPDDLQSIAETIDWLIDHPEERKNFGKNGRNSVLNQYNAENYAKGLLEFVENEIYH